MAEIKCPKCGQVFKADEAGLAAIVEQVRSKEFKKEVDKRIKEGILQCTILGVKSDSKHGFLKRQVWRSTSRAV